MDNYAGNVQSPQMFQMPGMAGAASGALSGIGNLGQFGNIGSNVLPGAVSTAQNLINNPYGTQGIQGAQNAANLGGTAAMTGFNEGGGLVGAGNSLIPYASNIMQTGFDPQQALYNRTLQQVRDQANVNNAGAGVATTPYGAGLTDQATTNFNIDWQNAQLARQAQAAGAAGGLVGAGAGVAGQGVNMMNAAPGQLVQSAMLPYATYSDIGQGQNKALESLLGITGSGENLSQLPIQDLLSYLGVGNQSNATANQLFGQQLNQANLGWNQLGQLGGGLGSLASMLPWSSIFAGGAGAGGSAAGAAGLLGALAI